MKEEKNKDEIKDKDENMKHEEATQNDAQQAKECKEQEAQPQAETPDINAQLAAAKDDYLRLAAEFDNYRRRTAKERLDLIANASENVIKGFLPILDDCQRALDVLRSSDAGAAAIEGTELILNKIMNFLKSQGVAKIEAIGAEFDTDYHEAVAQAPIDDKKKKNKVIDVVSEGYTLNGKVIRYAKVVIGV